jgi:hypothetical protein
MTERHTETNMTRNGVSLQHTLLHNHSEVTMTMKPSLQRLTTEHLPFWVTVFPLVIMLKALLQDNELTW